MRQSPFKFWFWFLVILAKHGGLSFCREKGDEVDHRCNNNLLIFLPRTTKGRSWIIKISFKFSSNSNNIHKIIIIITIIVIISQSLKQRWEGRYGARDGSICVCWRSVESFWNPSAAETSMVKTRVVQTRVEFWSVPGRQS